jgi:hypothetical protein
LGHAGTAKLGSDVHRAVAHPDHEHPLARQVVGLVRIDVVVRVQLDSGKFAGKWRVRPVRLPVVSVGDRDRVVRKRPAVVERDFEGSRFGAFDSLNTGLERDLFAKPEVVDVGVEVARDQLVMRKIRVAIGHRVVRVLHPRARGVDVQAAVGTAPAVLVLEHPIAADSVALFVAVERDRLVGEGFGHGDPRRPRADQANSGQLLHDLHRLSRSACPAASAISPIARRAARMLPPTAQ